VLLRAYFTFSVMDGYVAHSALGSAQHHWLRTWHGLTVARVNVCLTLRVSDFQFSQGLEPNQSLAADE